MLRNETRIQICHKVHVIKCFMRFSWHQEIRLEKIWIETAIADFAAGILSVTKLHHILSELVNEWASARIKMILWMSPRLCFNKVFAAIL